MNQLTRKRHILAFALSDRWRSLVISCLIASVTVVSIGHVAAASAALPAPESTAKPIATPAPTAPVPITPIPVAKRLLGQWLTKEPLEGDIVMLVFAPDGKVFILSGTTASGNAIVSQLHYRLDDTPKPIHLDLVLSPAATVETLFEFTATDELRMQMQGIGPGKPRPAALTDNATLFQKISDDTTPPSGIELKKPSAPEK